MQLIVQDILQTHEMVFWIDSSIRMLTSDLESVYNQAVSHGLVMFDFAGHNIFMATHVLMYRYLPITIESAVNVSMYGANAIFIRRSKQVGNVFVRLTHCCNVSTPVCQIVLLSVVSSCLFVCLSVLSVP